MDDEIFILASTDKMPDSLLKGYAFDGSNMICGDKGYTEFRSERQKTIQPGQDGGYVVVNSKGRRTTIGTDYTGNFKLYIYQHGKVWAISNSLIELAKYARSKDLPVTINTAQLASFLIYPRRLGDQLSSFSTSVREINLVPARFQIDITRGWLGQKVMINQVDEVSSFEEVEPDYEAQMARFIEVWLGRFVAILNSDIKIKLDITGGLDSRTVLSLVLCAGQIAGWDKLQKVLFFSNSIREEDFKVAHQLAKAHNFSIHSKIYRSYEVDDYRIDTEIGYGLWRKLFPGTYMPVIFPTVRRESDYIWIVGNGGEAHRPDYEFSTIEALLENARQFIDNPGHYDEIREAALTDTKRVQVGLEAELNSVLTHYRHFRDRFHHGRRAIICNSVAPLSSRYLRFVNNVASPEIFDSRRILTDIITNCLPELFDTPFDDPRKQFVPTGAFGKAKMDAIKSRIDSGGKVFAERPYWIWPGKFLRRGAIDMLRADFDASLPLVQDLGIFPKEYLQMGDAYLTEAQSTAIWRQSRHGSPAAHVSFAGDLMKIAGSAS